MKVAVFVCIATFSVLAASQPTRTIVDILQQNENKEKFSTLLQAAQAAGIVDNLQKGGPVTLFAPTNDAFKKLPEATTAKLLANPAELQKVLLMHVVKGAIMMDNLKDGNLPSIDGALIKVVTGDDKVVTVNGARIIPPTTPEMNVASNGVLYTIDRVILP